MAAMGASYNGRSDKTGATAMWTRKRETAVIG